MSRRRSSFAALAFAAACVLAQGTLARAADGKIETPSAGEVEETLPAGKDLTGHEIYDRFLKNRKRLRTVAETGHILSRDPAGNPQETRFILRAKDYRDAHDDAVDGIYSKTLVKITGPRELEHTGYLYVHRSDRADDQFIYSPMRMRTARASIRGQNVAGTDFSFDDFLTSLDDIEDAHYTRHADETVDGTLCYVVEAVMKPGAKSRYTKSIVYVEKEHYVPLRTRYWDDVGVEAKALTSPHRSVKNYDGVWVPTESTMTDLLEDTQSTLTIDTLDPNPPLTDTDFSTSVLEQKS